MGISIDGTFAIQIASFFILWAALRRLLFDPMLGVLEERERRTTGARDDASHMHADVAAMRAEYDQRVRGAREASLADLEASRKVTASEEHIVLSAARERGAARLAQTRAKIAEELVAARGILAKDAAGLANELVSKVVGRGVA